MGKLIIGAALLAGVALGAGGSAFSQTPPSGGPGGPDRGPGMWHDMDQMGPGRFEPGMRGMRHPPRAAVFMMSRGDTRMMIKCSDDEPTRACVDAASALIDKLGSSTAAGAGTH
jgi:hypothetical protein